MAMLNIYLAKNQRGLTEKLFPKMTSKRMGEQWNRAKQRAARKLQNPTILKFRLYDLRHYFATNLYDKTKDILLVKQQMGHKKLDTTLIYTQILNPNEDEWTCRGATTVEQATQLIENGFEYVTEIDGLKLFRKRK